MYIVVVKRSDRLGDYDAGIIFEKMEEVVAWANSNRQSEFRVFQGTEFEVIKDIQFKPKPVTRGV